MALSMLLATVMAATNDQDTIVACSWVIFTICAIMTSFGLFLSLLLLLHEVFSRTKELLLKKQGGKAKLEPATPGKAYHQKVDDTSISVDQTMVTETATTRQDTKKGDFSKVPLKTETKLESDAMQKFRMRAAEARKQQNDKKTKVGEEWNVPDKKKTEQKETPKPEETKGGDPEDVQKKRRQSLKKRRQSVKSTAKTETSTQPSQPNQKYTEQQKKATMQSAWLSKQKELLTNKDKKTG